MENEKEKNFKDIERKEEESFFGIGLLRSIIVFTLGLIGIDIIFSIVSGVGKLFVPELVRDTPEYYQINGIYQFITYFLLFVAIFFAIGIKNIKKIISKFKDYHVYFEGLIFGFLVIGAQIVYNLIISFFYPDLGANSNQNALVLMAKQVPVLMTITVVIFGPICEEFTYRWALFGQVKKLNRVAAYIVTMLVFALIHFDFTVFGDSEKLTIELLNLPSYILAGLILCIAYDHSGSLITSSVAHMINNLVSMIGVFVN